MAVHVGGRGPGHLARVITLTSYDPDATAYFAAMTVPPSAARKTLINNLILGLKTDGLWAKIEWLSLVAAHDAQAARLNAKTPAQSMSVVNSPAFTTDRGYTGDGTSAALNLPNNLNTMTLFTQNSAFWFISNRAALTQGASQWAFGIVSPASTPTIGLNFAGSQSGARCASTATSVLFNDATPVGRYIASRNNSATIDIYKNGASADPAASSTSAAPNASPPSLLRTGVNFSTAQVSAFAMGSALTSTDAANLDSRISTYLTAIGA